MKSQNIYKNIENIGLQAKEFVILALPQIDEEPLKSLFRRVAKRKINTVIIYSESDGNLAENKKNKWAERCTFIKTERLEISYVISEKSAISFRNENINNASNVYYTLSNPYSENYLENIHELHIYINRQKNIFDFSKLLPCNYDNKMKWLHSDLLFKNKYDVEKEYYDSTYILFCKKAKELYPVLPDYIDSILGWIIPKRWRLTDEIYTDLYDKLSKLGTPYSFDKSE